MSTNRLHADPFVRAYLHAAAFTQDPEPGQGEYPEPDRADLDPAFIARAEVDCAKFRSELGPELAAIIEADEAHAGRDFWYTRNGHGCGFWDGDWPRPEGWPIVMGPGDLLTEIIEQFYGEVDDPVFADGRDQDGDEE